MAPTQTVSEQRRTFRGNADSELEHPVDAAGRVRWRATLDSRTIQMRAEGDPIGFSGHAAMFDTPAWIGGRTWGFWEKISSGAFDKTIRENDIRFLKNHDPNFLLARNKAGNLTLSEDNKGLSVEADMVPTTFARDLALLLDKPSDSAERSTIDQMSFSFEPIAWKRDENDEGEVTYTLTEVRLWDVAVVTYPAYVETDASLRSAAFGALAQRLGAEPSKLLRAFADTGEFGDQTLTDLRNVSREGTDGADTSEPPEGTRDDSQPDETTGSTPTTHQRELRRQMLAKRTQAMEV